jgi:hypothetical protein
MEAPNDFDKLPVELKYKVLEILISHKNYDAVLRLREINILNKEIVDSFLFQKYSKDIEGENITIEDIIKYVIDLNSDIVTEYYGNGNIKSIKYYKKGTKILHRFYGTAVINYNYDGIKSSEEYYINNKKHRNNGPANILYWLNGNKRKDEYYMNNELHRIDGPAVINYYSNGIKYVEKYYIDGKLHRTDGPAHIEYLENNIERERYYKDGKLHRTDGPAFIEYSSYYTKEKKIGEKYYIDDKLHRTDGPAYIYYWQK